LTTFWGNEQLASGRQRRIQIWIKNFLIFGSGGAQKANDYRTPLGTV